MLDLNKIYQGDCLEVMKGIDDNSVDMVLTSPPYDNLRTYNGSLNWGEHIWKPIIQELFRTVKEGGVVVWVVGDATIKGSETGTSFKQALYFKEIGFNLHDTMIYQKANFSNPSSTRYHQIFEYMFVFSKGSPKTFNPIVDRKNITVYGSLGKNTTRKANGEFAENSRRVNGEYGMRYNIWRMNTAGQENMCKGIQHPAVFPDALANDHILSWSNSGDIVLDPMCGSGTTCKMAKLNNRNYIGIEISEEYCEIAKQRIEETLCKTK